MGLKVAIVGLSPSKKEAPFNTEWEVWGLAWDQEDWCRYTRCFDIHDISLITYGGDNYHKKLQSIDCLYMQKQYYPNVTIYPLKEVMREIGDYFVCSIAYMLGLAIYEKAEEIKIYGVDMTDEKYLYQQPNVEYLIGLARGKGINVTINDSSPLCKYKKIHIYPLRYGYL